MADIVITREDPERLRRQVWQFYVTATPGGDIKAYLQHYSAGSRPSTRHKYRVDNCYGRIDRRDSTIQNVQHVPQPSDVLAEAQQELARRTSVVISDGRDVEAPFGNC